MDENRIEKRAAAAREKSYQRLFEWIKKTELDPWEVKAVIMDFCDQNGRRYPKGNPGRNFDISKELTQVLIDETSELRRMLWLCHGHKNELIGDNGEMVCRQCGIDFKRDPISVLQAKLYKIAGKDTESGV